MPTSRPIVDFLGRTIVQHYDDADRLLGTSFRRPSVTGHDRWEHYDEFSRSLGATDDADDFFGSYGAHCAALGRRPGGTVAALVGTASKLAVREGRTARGFRPKPTHDQCDPMQ